MLAARGAEPLEGPGVPAGGAWPSVVRHTGASLSHRTSHRGQEVSGLHSLMPTRGPEVTLPRGSKLLCVPPMVPQPRISRGFPG